MKIGTITQKRCRAYDLTPQEVYFAELLHSGATQIEAYCLIFPTATAAPTTAARDLLTSRPGIGQLLTALAANQPTDNRAASRRPARRDGRESGGGDGAGGRDGEGSGSGSNISTKEGQLRELQQIYDSTADVKTRADILKQVSDLQRLKQQDEREDVQRIHYYLPAKCQLCPFKPRE